MTHDPWFEDGRTGALAVAELQRAAYGMLVARRAMRGVMPEPLLSDLALEIMLALFIASPATKTIDDLFPTISVLPPLARRWIKVLASEQLVAAKAGRLRLTDRGLEEMTEMMTRVVKSQREIYGWKQ